MTRLKWVIYDSINKDLKDARNISDADIRTRSETMRTWRKDIMKEQEIRI